MALLVDMSWRYWWICHGFTAESYVTFYCVILLVFTAVACVMGVTVLNFVTFSTVA